MKEEFKEYFHYTRSERNGLIVLAISCLFFVGFPTIYKHFFKKTSQTDFSELKLEIEAFNQSNEIEQTFEETVFLFDFDPNTASKSDFLALGLSKKIANTIENYRNKGGRFYKKEDFKKIYGISENDFSRLKDHIVFENTKKSFSDFEQVIEREKVVELFEFDPNTVSREELTRLGLSQKVINTMMNFRKKGGTFRKREDLSKIYGLSEEDFERLFPFIKITNPEPTNQLAKNEPKVAAEPLESGVKFTIEINTAAPEDWQKLKGIGPYYSKKICNFRDKLGGFISIEQIAETYGLPDSTYQKIKPILILEGSVQKIDLNTATASQLAAHPYLKWKQANAIVKYRGTAWCFFRISTIE